MNTRRKRKTRFSPNDWRAPSPGEPSRYCNGGGGGEGPPGGGEGPPQPLPDPVIGIDVSHYQAAINWAATLGTSTRPAFVYVKASEGYKLDPKFRTNWASLKGSGVYRGAYHYFRPAKKFDPTRQARIFAQAMGALGQKDLPPVLDLEARGWPSKIPARIKLVADILSELKNFTRRRPIIYTQESFMKAVLKSTTQFCGYELWVIDYKQCPPSSVTRPKNAEDRSRVLVGVVALGRSRRFFGRKSSLLRP